MRYVAGIDGGQTTTAAVVGDERGRILGRGVAGPADEIGQGAGSTRMHDALSGALHAACENADIPADTHFEAAIAGVSGYEGRVYGKVPQLPASRFVLMHDAPIAHAGALAGRPGVVVIAGTGSVVYATDGERGWTLGGWGYLFGDEGSAFWFACSAIRGAMYGEDCGVEPNDARERICSYFGVSSLRALARGFYSGEISRDRIASFASELARRPIEWRPFAPLEGAMRLAMLVREAVVRGAPPRVALVGGMFSDKDFAADVREHVKRWLPEAEIVQPTYDPAVGALLLAYSEAGIRGIEIAS